ncbi:MAG TPA: hypothetical protein VEI01_12415 [Terriglobales bacterium]|nr:hypothetical protein [Terriglobales bacterium]
MRLAAAGINTLTVDNRGYGESGGTYDNWTAPHWKEVRKQYWPHDLDTANTWFAAGGVSI